MAVFSIDGWSSSKAANEHEIEIPFGLIPTSQGHSSLDVVACTDEDIISIQVTVAPEHDMLSNGFEAFEKHLPQSF